MRISVDMADVDGYAAWALLTMEHGNTSTLKVFVDGVEQNHCIMADTDAGVIERYQVDADGQLVLNAEKTEILREKVHGTVRLEIGGSLLC